VNQYRQVKPLSRRDGDFRRVEQSGELIKPVRVPELAVKTRRTSQFNRQSIPLYVLVTPRRREWFRARRHAFKYVAMRLCHLRLRRARS